jgi:putative hemolysin
MRLVDAETHTNAATSRLTLSLANTHQEVREVQRLRYKIFIETAGRAGLANDDGIDAEALDPWCDHLIVRDTRALKVVGTCRLRGPAASRKQGRFYSEGEFDLGRIAHLRNSTVEAGRACIDPDYRSGAVIMLLWAGLAAYMQRHRCEYLVGCAGICLADREGRAL